MPYGVNIAFILHLLKHNWMAVKNDSNVACVLQYVYYFTMIFLFYGIVKTTNELCRRCAQKPTPHCKQLALYHCEKWWADLYKCSLSPFSTVILFKNNLLSTNVHSDQVSHSSCHILVNLTLCRLPIKLSPRREGRQSKTVTCPLPLVYPKSTHTS